MNLWTCLGGSFWIRLKSECGWYHSMAWGCKLHRKGKRSWVSAWIFPCILTVVAMWSDVTRSFCYDFPAMMAFSLKLWVCLDCFFLKPVLSNIFITPRKATDGGWRYYSEVQNTCSSCTRLRFDIQYSHNDSQPSITLVAGDLIPSSGLQGH